MLHTKGNSLFVVNSTKLSIQSHDFITLEKNTIAIRNIISERTIQKIMYFNQYSSLLEYSISKRTIKISVKIELRLLLKP